MDRPNLARQSRFGRPGQIIDIALVCTLLISSLRYLGNELWKTCEQAQFASSRFDQLFLVPGKMVQNFPNKISLGQTCAIFHGMPTKRGKVHAVEYKKCIFFFRLTHIR